ncbi:hypothetical protein FIV42_09750 [Persicimonas caeni]|uniref:Uncharacterized protein n=1 Tax=Persicimonas caeni TaxID=2292766 RepID=A0A4Y6PSC0_PERCE|nr:hypothetical protein [Persicimonas caeni]QDG51009.1 hypothetical protein FIV42_09750 [Persicimonas caeni]QED32230.1 hypothetical protein FRD00_09745 [Persicimonas caeni]
MHGLHAYLELVENGRPLDQEPQAPGVHEPLMKLLAHAHAEGELGVEGAWRLDSRECRKLEQRYGMSPPGGWSGLAGLACGCGVLRARREGFAPEMQLAELTHWDDAAARRLLLEAFTRLLVPPAAAAGLFILMGLHPAWGLRVAHSTHARGRAEFTGEEPDADLTAGIEPGWRDESLFPEQTAAHIEEAVFSAIAAIVAALRKLSPNERYPIDALGGLVHAASMFARQCAEENLDSGVDMGLAPFLGEARDDAGVQTHRTLDFATVDLLDSLLVPAGVARRFDDGTFCVFGGALEGVRVGELDADAQEVKLTWMLAGEAGCMVA